MTEIMPMISVNIDAALGRSRMMLAGLALILAWGDLNRPGNRYMAFDKRTGDIMYVSNPGGRPYDTAYAAPTIATLPDPKSTSATCASAGETTA